MAEWKSLLQVYRGGNIELKERSKGINGLECLVHKYLNCQHDPITLYLCLYLQSTVYLSPACTF